MKAITTKQAAEKLGLSVQRIRALITAGRLPAQKLGRDFVIQENDLKLVAVRIPGRPSKQATKRKGGK